MFPDSPLTLVAAHRHPHLNRLCTQDRQIRLRLFVTAKKLFPSIGTNVRTMNNFNYKPISLFDWWIRCYEADRPTTTTTWGISVLHAPMRSNCSSMASWKPNTTNISLIKSFNSSSKAHMYNAKQQQQQPGANLLRCLQSAMVCPCHLFCGDDGDYSSCLASREEFQALDLQIPGHVNRKKIR